MGRCCSKPKSCERPSWWLWSLWWGRRNGWVLRDRLVEMRRVKDEEGKDKDDGREGGKRMER